MKFSDEILNAEPDTKSLYDICEEYSKKLKQCPFCGSDNVGMTYHDGFFVNCYNCNTGQTSVGSEQECVDKWNTRYTPKPENKTKETYLCDLCGMKEPTHQVINHGTKLCADCAVGYIYPCREI